MADKVIVSNQSALLAKYKTSGVKAIRKAVQDLIAADRGRGLTTITMDLGDAATMKKYGALAANPANAGQNKRAIDAVYTALAPDYILLLGSTDIIPHQDLNNPVFNPRRPKDDDDRVVPSDLPYACESGYSMAIENFTGPTRVVGRLPDLTGASDPAYLLDALQTAQTVRCRARADYEKYLGITAAVWKKSTDLNLSAIFGSGAAKIAPPDLPPWQARLLARLSHFINCHGAVRSPEFYGQRGREFPVSLASSDLAGKLSDGVVAATECCYGAELYPVAAGLKPGIANMYLANGAYGYLGSTTTAYGPADSNDWADLLCQYFWQSLLTGASLGRAFLEARQKYVQAGPTPLGPVDLKTLGQFILLGDPSVVAVKTESPAMDVPAKFLAQNIRLASATGRASRLQRRKDLIANGIAISHTWPSVRSKAVAPGAALKRLQSIAREIGMKDPSIMTYKAPAMRGFTTRQPKALLAKQADVDAVHVMIEQRFDPAENTEIPHTVVVVVREAKGKTLSVTQGFGKSGAPWR